MWKEKKTNPFYLFLILFFVLLFILIFADVGIAQPKAGATSTFSGGNISHLSDDEGPSLYLLPLATW